MALEDAWFSEDEIPEGLSQTQSFRTRDLAEVVQDDSSDLTSTQKLLQKLFKEQAAWQQLDIRLQV